ncbi:MarC family protein [Sphingobium yanoikuyae]|uniref:MarC family protein n=1 Tax=Sphingobium yanoikuyae TaxID=13690 RepID=UPI0028B070B5|nr:MarC family protein [Sphingobium yanoikuyae]
MNDLSFVLVIFFVTLGPIKVIAAFAQLTSQLPDGERRALALRSTLIATAVGFLILFIGDNLRQNWQIASPDLLLTGGLLLLIGALEAVKNAQHAPPPGAPPTSAKGLAMSPVTFPIIITPYGIVALLLFAAVAGDTRTFLTGVFGIFLGMMVADFLAMIFARQLLGFIHAGTLMAFGWMIAVLQAALAIHAIMSGLQQYGVVPGPLPVVP